MAYSNPVPRFPLSEISDDILSLKGRLESAYVSFQSLTPQSAYGGYDDLGMVMNQIYDKIRSHLRVAIFSLENANMKAFHKKIGPSFRIDPYIPPKTWKKAYKICDWLCRDLNTIITEIETIHLHLGEQSCNFWAFIALERTHEETQLAKNRLDEALSLVASRRKEENVHSIAQSST